MSTGIITLGIGPSSSVTQFLLLGLTPSDATDISLLAVPFTATYGAWRQAAIYGDWEQTASYGNWQQTASYDYEE